MKLGYIISGIILVLASLWGGAFAMTVLDGLYDFAAYMTATFLFIGGAVLTVFGVMPS